jgi:hypothetical protein
MILIFALIAIFLGVIFGACFTFLLSAPVAGTFIGVLVAVACCAGMGAAGGRKP